MGTIRVGAVHVSSECVWGLSPKIFTCKTNFNFRSLTSFNVAVFVLPCFGFKIADSKRPVRLAETIGYLAVVILKNRVSYCQGFGIVGAAGLQGQGQLPRFNFSKFKTGPAYIQFRFWTFNTDDVSPLQMFFRNTCTSCTKLASRILRGGPSPIDVIRRTSRRASSHDSFKAVWEVLPRLMQVRADTSRSEVEPRLVYRRIEWATT